MLLNSGFTSSQTDSLLSSFVLSDDSPPSNAEVTLEIVTALDPIKQSLSDMSEQSLIKQSLSDITNKQLACNRYLYNEARGHPCMQCAT
jgi:hypothetical protein